MLRTNFHQRLARLRFRITRLARGRGGYLSRYNSLRKSARRDPSARDPHELPAIHSCLLIGLDAVYYKPPYFALRRCSTSFSFSQQAESMSSVSSTAARSTVALHGCV